MRCMVSNKLSKSVNRYIYTHTYGSTHTPECILHTRKHLYVQDTHSPPLMVTLALCVCQANHMRSLCDFVDAQASYYAQCDQHTQELQRQMSRSGEHCLCACVFDVRGRGFVNVCVCVYLHIFMFVCVCICIRVWVIIFGDLLK